MSTCGGGFLSVVGRQSDRSIELVTICIHRLEVQFGDADHGWVISHVVKEADQLRFLAFQADGGGMLLEECVVRLDGAGTASFD